MRFKVIEGSESAHCCFAATVVDTTKPSMVDGFETICECFDLADAEIVCAALNATVETTCGAAVQPSEAREGT